MSKLSTAIQKIRPNSEFTFENDDYSTIKWHVLDGSEPTDAEIEAAIKEVISDEAKAEKKLQADKSALLEKLGITADEAALLLK
jgi:hypothetical protein